MKTTALLLLGWMVAVGALAADRVFVLATAGDVDPRVADQVGRYLEDQAGVVVRRRDPVPMQAGQSLEAIGRIAAQLLRNDEFGIVVLARPDTPQPQGVCLPHERFGILNVARLEDGASPERLIRRAGQDGLRVLSMLLDMSPCPFPLCVLTGFEKTEDLDGMSGNYCPPCQDRFLRLASANGLRRIESPPSTPDADDPDAAEPQTDPSGETGETTP